jgi:Uma2 family endonuclease
MSIIEAPGVVPPSPQVWPLSVRAYHALGDMGLVPEKTELLYGQVFQKMPKSPLHSLLLLRLIEILRRVLPPGMHARHEQPVTCADSEPAPDISVIQGSIEDYPTEHPQTAELVIEVCATSHDYDRSKLRAYAQARVKEVWLVLAPERQIEVHREPLEERFRERIVHGPGGRLASSILPQFAVELDALFASRKEGAPRAE